MHSTEFRITETERQALSRLLDKAKSEGVRLYRDHDGRHYASSASQPGTLHYVTGYSCDCRGFVSHGRCKHYAALLSALGWLQDDPEPSPVTTISITHVNGYYSLPGLQDRGGEYIEPISTIMVDGTEKIRITGDTFGLSVQWIENGWPIDDLTGCTPSCLDHYGAVTHWIEALDTSQPAYVAMKNGGLFPAREFTDRDPIAA